MPFYIKSNKLNLSKAHKKTNFIDKNIIPNHININTSNRLFGKNPSTSMSVYSSQNPYGGVGDAGIWVRNPNCWINGISNISCFSPAQRSGANWWQRGGTLITKKHVLFAQHFVTSVLPNGGTPLIFVDENNNAIKRNIIEYAYDNTDVAVALLSEEVPSNIKIAKVLPKNLRDYIRHEVIEVESNDLISFWFTPYLYAIGLDQEEKAILKIFSGAVATNVSSGVRYSSASFFSPQINSNYNTIPNKKPYPLPNQFADWSENMIVGDSGNPVFIIIDNELVVLTTWWTPSGGPFISDTTRYDAINSLIESLSPNQGYSLTPVDLAAVYNKYSLGN